MAGDVAVTNGQVGHEHHGQVVVVDGLGLVEQGLEKFRHALVSMGVVSLDGRETGGIGKRDSGHNALVAHLDEVAADVGMPISVTGDAAQDVHAGILPQAAVALEACRAVMVTGNDDDRHPGACLMNVDHGIDIEADGGARRRGRVENVTADEQGVGLLFAHDVGQLTQEVPLLLAAVIAIEILAQVPVAGVDEPKHG